jgi:putative DNA methylase
LGRIQYRRWLGGEPGEIGDDQQNLFAGCRTEIDRLNVETDGWLARPSAFLYCVEARCPQTGWMVPLLPTRIVSVEDSVVAELLPDDPNKRYDIGSALVSALQR